MEVIDLTRRIMDYLNAFKGSRPIAKDSQIMIIKGKSADRIKAEELAPLLKKLFEDMNIKEIQVTSSAAEDITKTVDEKLRMNNMLYEDETPDVLGLESLKESFEKTGFNAEYMIGKVEDLGAYVVLYLDKSGFGPVFVETMVVKLDNS